VKILVTFVKLFHQNNQKNYFGEVTWNANIFFFFFGVKVKWHYFKLSVKI
jgi:hypothetical protein